MQTSRDLSEGLDVAGEQWISSKRLQTIHKQLRCQQKGKRVVGSFGSRLTDAQFSTAPGLADGPSLFALTRLEVKATVKEILTMSVQSFPDRLPAPALAGLAVFFPLA